MEILRYMSELSVSNQKNSDRQIEFAVKCIHKETDLIISCADGIQPNFYIISFQLKILY